MFKKGDVIQSGKDKREVLGVCEDIVFVSHSNKFNEVGFYRTQKELEKKGYNLVKYEWEPEINNQYWFLNESGEIKGRYWDNDVIDNSTRNFLGVFETKEKAEKRLKEIKEKLNIKQYV